ncbi:GNAT family N-acetyltransferase [Mesorhizobium sp. NPDC059025]|jgi:RimJ/RimL family protein N-acetyltransferase|uniref:GNAT family N-acetyltransferase n=1 Tax=unclassified Mesorhizobium TaxID=325217 RepID=UPI00367D87F5
MMRIVVDEAGEHLDAAARIWAEATSRRDNDKDVPSLELSRPIIKRVLEISERSFLLMVFEDADGGRPVAFTAVAPVPGDEDMAELHYLGVEPPSWGRSYGAVALVATQDALLERGFAVARLSVYVDNQRAVQFYQRGGWQPHGEALPHPRTGKPEQRYRLFLDPLRR